MHLRKKFPSIMSRNIDLVKVISKNENSLPINIYVVIQYDIQ